MKSFLTRLISGFLLLAAVSVSYAVIETYEFETEADRLRYHHFLEVLRCPKCQNQNLEGSNSPIAEDLRRELARQIREGKQDREIEDFMVARYGDFVLYDPRFKKNTWLLWLAPLLLLLAGVAALFFQIRRKQEQPKQDEGYLAATPGQPALQQPLKPLMIWIVAVAISLFVICGSLFVYMQIGAAQQLVITHATQKFYGEVNNASAENRAPDLTSGRELVVLLKPYLEQHQDDLNLVYVLGSTYAHLSEFELAIPLYKQYLMAAPTDERVLTEYVQLLYATADRQLTERVLFVVDRALTLNPHNIEVLTLMAMHYHQAGLYTESKAYWSRILAVLPKGTPSYQMVERALTDAKLKSGRAARNRNQ